MVGSWVGVGILGRFSGGSLSGPGPFASSSTRAAHKSELRSTLLTGVGLGNQQSHKQTGPLSLQKLNFTLAGRLDLLAAQERPGGDL
jgi:hypothetical protein